MATQELTTKQITERVSEIRAFVLDNPKAGIQFYDIATRGWTEHGQVFKHYEHPVIEGAYGYDGARTQQLRADVRELLSFVDHMLAERREMLKIIEGHHHDENQALGPCECKHCTEFRSLTALVCKRPLSFPIAEPTAIHSLAFGSLRTGTW